MRGRARWMLLGCMLAALAPASGRADDVSSSVYVRSDTDGTHVVTPSVGARVSVFDESTHVEAGYSADIWTSASIDIRTAATKRITEQRDELTLAIERELLDVTLRADYRFSNEPDYVSHGGGLSLEQQFAQNNASVETRIFAAGDRVGRAGDDNFSRDLATVGIRVAYTQVLDPETILQLAYQLSRLEGFQSSPYRFVGVGGDGSCAGTAPLCLPEAHPGTRLRNAAVARARRSFGRHASAGLAYRFYGDDWGLLSHTAIGQVSWLPNDRTNLTARYRFYRQSGASFYEPRYELGDGPLQFVSRDRELSALMSNRLALSVEHDFDLTEAGPPTRAAVVLGGALLSYDEFVGLDRVWALDVVVGATVEL